VIGRGEYEGWGMVQFHIGCGANIYYRELSRNKEQKNTTQKNVSKAEWNGRASRGCGRGGAQVGGGYRWSRGSSIRGLGDRGRLGVHIGRGSQRWRASREGQRDGRGGSFGGGVGGTKKLINDKEGMVTEPRGESFS